MSEHGYATWTAKNLGFQGIITAEPRHDPEVWNHPVEVYWQCPHTHPGRDGAAQCAGDELERRRLPEPEPERRLDTIAIERNRDYPDEMDIVLGRGIHSNRTQVTMADLREIQRVVQDAIVRGGPQ